MRDGICSLIARYEEEKLTLYWIPPFVFKLQVIFDYQLRLNVFYRMILIPVI